MLCMCDAFHWEFYQAYRRWVSFVCVMQQRGATHCIPEALHVHKSGCCFNCHEYSRAPRRTCLSVDAPTPTGHVQVIGESPQGTADVSSAPYLQAVVLEALRLRPPAYIVGRCAARAVTLGAFSLPAGEAPQFSGCTSLR